MAASVATPLEKQFSTIAGLEVITSTSFQGNTQIALQFALDRDIDAAASDVQAAITQTIRQLPQNIVPPTYQKVDPSQSPIIVYALTSASLKLSQLDEFGQVNIGQRLSTVEGVAQVQVYGSQKYAVRIQLDPQAMAARQIGIDEVSDAIEQGNVNLPTGILWGTDRAYAVQATGQLQNASEFRPLIVAWRNGRAGAAGRPRPRHRQRAGHQGRRLVQPDPRHRPRHLPAAGHQHRRGGGPGAPDHEGDRAQPAAVGGRDHHLRPLRDDPRVG